MLSDSKNDIRITKPNNKYSDDNENRTIAIFIHAHKLLGGSMNDRPLQVLTKYFINHNIIVVNYNRSTITLNGENELRELDEIINYSLKEVSNVTNIIIVVCIYNIFTK